MGNPFKAAKKVLSSVNDARKSITKEIGRGGESILQDVKRDPLGYATFGMSSQAEAGMKAVGGALVPDINMPAQDDTAARLLAAQERRAANANADLTLENIVDVESGGTASSLGGMDKKKKRTGQNVSTSLGINT